MIMGMNKRIALLPLVAVLMLSSCVGQQPVWLDAPMAGAESEARMLPVASGIPLGETTPIPSLGFVGVGAGYLWTDEKSGSDRYGGEIHIIDGEFFRKEDSRILTRLDAIFLGSQGGNDNYVGVGIGSGRFLPHHLSPYVFIEGMLGYADADSELVVALLPEIGMNFWIPWSPIVRSAGESNFCIGVGARYFLSSQGRDDDFWLVGVSLTVGDLNIER